ncbi:MAG: hypothetical protein LUC24_00160 [Bacteroidales bacterium]|nr:hypothetical protein [Bacteroidales bacterium]
MIKATGDNVINSIGDHNHNTTTINGAGNATTLDKAMDEIAAQRRLTEKSQQQIDRLLTIIESMNSK